MNKFLLPLFFLLFTVTAFAQISGKVTDVNGNPLGYVNIFIENTFTGTTSNDDGDYELNVTSADTYTIVFQFLGFKTIKKTVEIETFPYTLNTILEEEQISLSEVVINSNENPANKIMRAAIANRKSNLEKIKSYKADFYSRGLIRIKDAPEKILGQEVGDLGGGLDSTRSGIIYLSETISKLEFLQPDNLKERIIASKVSGNDNGFSFNAALDVDYNLYNNTVELGNEIVSPIADFAFNYYEYKLDGAFFDDRGNLINKIKVIPKRENDRIFSGYIYIVEDQWDIYALELEITGQQAQIPAADIITLSQNFSYSKANDIWALISQRIDFEYGIFGITGNGTFTAVYNNYLFNPIIETKDFGREVLSFENEANKKDSLYWAKIRPVPLTSEEISDYVKKDSIQILRESKPYLDSIDQVANKFNLFDIVSGYSFQNSYKDYRFGIGSPIGKVKFNTVQGFNSDIDLFFRKNYDEFRRYLNVSLNLNYGYSEDRWRPTAAIFYKFNNIQRNTLGLSGGVVATQFNGGLTSLPKLNSLYSLIAERNYLKIYENAFAQLSYSQELFNGLRASTTFSYQKRKPLFNNTDQVWFNNDDRDYSSNNPLDANAYGIAPLEEHHILKLSLNASITFGQKYMSYPDSKFNILNDKYPTLNIGYEKGFGSDISDYNYDQFKARLSQDINLGNKGDFKYNLKAGTFLNSDKIAFIDYQHFNGNQTNIGTSANYLDVFNNLPYYSMSTNKSYFEAHIEHDFSGYILGKVPLLNKLNYNLIIGAHALSTQNHTPYQELSVGIDNIGFGKLRFLRLDYVRSYQNGYEGDALIFGLKIFNFID
ncbi:CarboxypepD_reg-like domain-containing protein [Flavobacteriaceae bacterium MAR_2010_188]|nr:CarboxypepD_reg-like domain-containing protein [Flavobacteriaceae bacterium MAR_2010_188]